MSLYFLTRGIIARNESIPKNVTMMKVYKNKPWFWFITEIALLIVGTIVARGFNINQLTRYGEHYEWTVIGYLFAAVLCVVAAMFFISFFLEGTQRRRIVTLFAFALLGIIWANASTDIQRPNTLQYRGFPIAVRSYGGLGDDSFLNQQPRLIIKWLEPLGLLFTKEEFIDHLVWWVIFGSALLGWWLTQRKRTTLNTPWSRHEIVFAALIYTAIAVYIADGLARPGNRTDYFSSFAPSPISFNLAIDPANPRNYLPDPHGTLKVFINEFFWITLFVLVAMSWLRWRKKTSHAE